jgi:hypothetical protein
MKPTSLESHAPHRGVLNMTWQDAALGLAGVIGSTVAVFHGILIQRLVVRLDAILLADKGMTAPFRRLVPGLLHFSTVTWFLGGLALIAAALWFEKNARLATGLFVGSLYLYGALGNLWVTRGLHPGWILMTVAVVLIVLGVNKPGG